MLTEKEKLMLARMEKQIAMPKWKYILFYGVLAWGIFTAIGVSLLSLLFFKKTVADIINRDLWINLVTFMIGGVFFGLLMRNWGLPKQVKQLKEKEQKV
jgi:pilus assembly protein TadC